METYTRKRGHRARLALSPAQEDRLNRQAHAGRALWNLLHDLFNMCGRERRPSLAYLEGEIRWARKNVDWLGMLPAQAAQAVLKTYHQAWVRCWEGKGGAPGFKSRLRSALSVDVPQGRDLRVVRVHRRWGMVNIPKLGRIRFRWTKDLPGVSRRSPAGRITGARLTKDALGWHIAFRAEWAVKDPPPQAWSESHVGIDRGIIVPIALSDGTSYDHRPWLTATEQACLLQAERQATHRRRYRKTGKQTSKRLHSVYDRIEGLRARAKRRALDWQHKTTTAIADQFTLVSVEQLAITNMLKSARGTLAAPGTNVSQKSGLNRRIAAEAWGRTVRLLDYKVTARGGALVRVPAPGTSLRCSVCNTITPGSRESQANFMCKNLACGWSGNADHNASRNIDRAGLELASAAGRAVVRQT